MGGGLVPIITCHNVAKAKQYSIYMCLYGYPTKACVQTGVHNKVCCDMIATSCYAMYATRTCLEKETLLPFRMCSVKRVDDSAVVLLSLVGFEKYNLTSLLNILYIIISSANHDLRQCISARNVSPPKKQQKQVIYKNHKKK